MTDEISPPDVSSVGATSPLEKLTRAQVFSRDPEELTPAHLEQVIEEISKINARQRKARNDDAAIAEAAAKMKKANTASRKKKALPVAAADIMDSKL